jgi:hypothetical protein
VTPVRDRLDSARRRVHTLLAWLAELQKRPDGAPALAAIAHRGLRDASRELSDAVSEALDDGAIAGPSLDRLPALERWRRLAVTNTARRSPLEVAAAHECTALLAALRGDTDAFDRAIAAARTLADTRAAS